MKQNKNDSLVCSICLSKKNGTEICCDNKYFIIKQCDCRYNLHKPCITEWYNTTYNARCLTCPKIITLRENYCKKIGRSIIVNIACINVFRFVVKIFIPAWLLTGGIILMYNILQFMYYYNKTQGTSLKSKNDE
jgi:hypothetical protein